MNAARRILWVAGTPLRAVLIGAIRLYRLTLAGWLGGQCRFYPSCSRYAEEAIRSRGAVRGRRPRDLEGVALQSVRRGRPRPGAAQGDV